MRLALDMASSRGQGSGTVGRQILAALAARVDHELLAFVPASTLADWPQGDRLELLPWPSGPHHKLRRETFRYPTALRRWGADVLFSLGDTGAPRPGVPHLLLVQQAFLAHEPSLWGFSAPPRTQAKFALMRAWFRACLPRVDRITVQTESMRHHLLDRWRPRVPVDVVPSSIGAAFKAAAGTWAPKDGRPTVAYVSSAGPHKNHASLADVMGIVRRQVPDARLALTIRPSDVPSLAARASEPALRDAFQFLGPLPADGAAMLVASAHAAILPSFLESFGIPLYEAMAVGCPLVASDRDWAREACGDAALYADPSSPEAIAEQLVLLLSSSERAREHSRRGLARHREIGWSWQEVADRYLELAAEIAGRTA